MFITRLQSRPLFLFEPNELSGGATPPDVEAPAADQPVADATPVETPAPDQVDAEQAPTEPEAPEADAEESFTDIDVSDLPEALQDRAKEMQADYTRKTQALADRHAELDNAVEFVTDLVSDEANETQEAVFRTLAAKLGYDIEGDDEDDDATTDADTEGDEPDTRTDREKYVDELREREQAEVQAKAEAEHEAHLDEVEAGITSGITELGKADGVELSDAEIDLIFNDVLGLPAHEGGPAVQAAYDRYKAATKAHTDRWVKSKTSTIAPDGPPAGEGVDFSNEEQRLAFTARAVEAAQRAQSGL